MKIILLTLMYSLIGGTAFAQFQRSYGTSQMEYGISLTNLTGENAKYLVAGFTTEAFIAGNEATLTKTDFFGNQLWSAFYGGQALDQFSSVRQSYFTGSSRVRYVAAGATHSFGFGGSDAWLVGTDINGVPMWSGIYGRERNDVFADVKNYRGVNFEQSGYVAVGSTMSYDFFMPERNAYVVKTDFFGNLVAATVIGYEGNQEGFWIEQTKDGGFILVGYADNAQCFNDPTQATPRDLLVVRLREDLTMVWNRVIGYPRYAGPLATTNIARAVKEDEQGNFYITGYTNAFGLDNKLDVFLLRMDPNGNFIDLNTYGTYCDNEYGFSLELSRDAAGAQLVTILGGDYTDNTTNNNALMFQLDNALNVLWAREYGLDGQDFGLELTSDSDHFAFTGYTNSLGTGTFDKYLVQTDLAGKSLTACENEIKLERVRHKPCVVKAVEQMFVDEYELIDVKFDRIQFEEGKCTTAGSRVGQVLIESGFTDMVVHPNPSQQSVAVTMQDGSRILSFKVVDIQGKRIEIPAADQAQGKVLSLDIQSLKRGVYLLEITAEDGQVIKKKIIKE